MIRIGDILQILTSEGVSYAQTTHKNNKYGYLIRVLDKFYDKKPKDLSHVVSQPVLFSAFFPAQSAVNQGLISIVGNTPVPESLQAFPTFRSRNGASGGSIWLWNGGDSVQLERRLLPEELKYPTEGIISAPLLVERIEKNYRAETHEVW